MQKSNFKFRWLVASTNTKANRNYFSKPISVFGISIKYEAWNQQDSLPVYIAGSYNFRTAYIGNKRCIILIPIEESVKMLPFTAMTLTRAVNLCSGLESRFEILFVKVKIFLFNV